MDGDKLLQRGERLLTRPRTAEEVNTSIRYSGWSVFRHLKSSPSQLAEVAQEIGLLGVDVRGWYDVSVLRGDADLMVWWHAHDVGQLQRAQDVLLSSPAGESLVPVWSGVGVHRPAEFNRNHVPAFLMGEAPGRYVCVYPFVRSYEWYLLPEAERRDLLAEHGRAAQPYADVRANTVSAFGLGDYEWLLAFEAEQLHRIVDLLRDLRATGARRHVRVEVPFYTGRRLDLDAARGAV